MLMGVAVPLRTRAGQHLKINAKANTIDQMQRTTCKTKRTTPLTVFSARSWCERTHFVRRSLVSCQPFDCVGGHLTNVGPAACASFVALLLVLDRRNLQGPSCYVAPTSFEPPQARQPGELDAMLMEHTEVCALLPFLTSDAVSALSLFLSLSLHSRWREPPLSWDDWSEHRQVRHAKSHFAQSGIIGKLKRVPWVISFL